MNVKDWNGMLRSWIDSGEIGSRLPEVAILSGILQHPEYHAEGDVLTHTLMATDSVENSEDEVTFLAVLLHDIGKYSTTRLIDGRLRSHGHAAVSAEMIPVCLERLDCVGFAEDVQWLVGHHHFLDAWQIEPGSTLTKGQRKLTQHHLFPRLLQVVEADQRGRIPLGSKKLDLVQWLREVG